MGEWHCGHSDFGGACKPQRERLEEVRDLDFLRLGTAIFGLRKTVYLVYYLPGSTRV